MPLTQYEPAIGDRVAYIGICVPSLPPACYVGRVDGFGEIEGTPIVYVVWDDGEMSGVRYSEIWPEGKESPCE